MAFFMIQAFSSSGVWDIFVLWRYYHSVLFCFLLFSAAPSLTHGLMNLTLIYETAQLSRKAAMSSNVLSLCSIQGK